MFVHLIATNLLLDDDIAYTKHLAPIFATQCAPCHNSKGSAPFDFSTYDGVKANLALIRQQLQSRAMPPVRISSTLAHSRFRQLTSEELIQFQQWDQAGAKLDSPVDSSVSTDPPVRFSHMIGNVGDHQVKSEGAPYWHVLDIKSASLPGSITSFSIRAMVPKAVRSVALVAAPKGKPIPLRDLTNVPPANVEFVGLWSPLFPVFTVPAGGAYKLPAGYEFKLWVLYQPQGKPVSGRVNLMAHSGAASARRSRTLRLAHAPFSVKARESKWLTISRTFKKDSVLYSATPLARFYCNVIDLSVVSPSGDTKQLATISKQDPYWPQTLQFPIPINLTAGSKLIASYFYANDEYCRMNEGKVPAEVKSGQKITDEACELRLLMSD